MNLCMLKGRTILSLLDKVDIGVMNGHRCSVTIGHNGQKEMLL